MELSLRGRQWQCLKNSGAQVTWNAIALVRLLPLQSEILIQQILNY